MNVWHISKLRFTCKGVRFPDRSKGLLRISVGDYTIRKAADCCRMAWKTSPSIFSFFNDIESVLKNLDISAFNILPSQCNITVDILTASSSAPSRTAVGTLSHVCIQALQLTLIDVLFCISTIPCRLSLPMNLRVF